ncbi:MAG: histidine ammonia-lyase [Firmicutes bacterium]|nr:histidine ammonia-lyase [Bacillota bacterium]
MEEIILNGSDLSLEDLIAVARFNAPVELSKEAEEKINSSRALVDKFVEEERVIYGITTGFGKFSEVHIPEDETKLLQKNLIMSHSCGVGKPLSIEIARAALVLRTNALAKGFSGIRLVTVKTMIEMLNKGITPIIPEKGSLGASGDLAPLSHMVQPMLGLGECYYKGEVRNSAEAMKEAGIDTIELTSKEGLALINGTQIMTAVGAITTYDALELLKIADIAASMTMEALGGIIDAYDERIAKVRPHEGMFKTTENVRRILDGSKNITRQGELRVQDAYSLRCVPQVHTGCKDCIDFVKTKVDIEMNSVTDNPIIFPEDEASISAGNFHGEPMALPFDFLGIGLSELANISERRLEKMVNPALSHGLPAFLAEKGGVNSGFMIVQYAAAALVSENKVLAHPASVDSIPSSANQEDHVSMGTIAARKAREIYYNSRKVLAMELLTAAQAIDLRGGADKLSKATKAVYDLIRQKSPRVEVDRIMNIDIEIVDELLADRSIVKAVESEIGELKA